MKIINELEFNPDLSLALGFFDGIHLGHKVVLASAVEFAKKNNAKSAVITFREHPLCVLEKRKPSYISTLDYRLEKIKQTGIDYVYLLNFDEKLSKLNAENYLKDILIKYFSPKAITTGFNHTFGKNREGNCDFLKKNQKKYNYVYQKIAPIEIGGILASSSNIRYDLHNGSLDKVKALLGYDYSFKSRVFRGEGLGKKIGFATINLKYPQKLMHLPAGVYSGIVRYDKYYQAVINYGTKPTVKDTSLKVLEAHLLNFDDEIYGKEVEISFLNKIRNEVKFDTLEELKKQIQKDINFSSQNKI